MSKLIAIEIDDRHATAPTAEIEQERKVAIFDLLEQNQFELPAREDGSDTAGPFKLHLAIREQRLLFDISHEDDTSAAQFLLALGPFRQVVKDYFQICESYFDALENLGASQVEAIDMARRGIHNEGARVVMERLEGKVTLDRDTARRLFTLICVLHWGGVR